MFPHGKRMQLKDQSKCKELFELSLNFIE